MSQFILEVISSRIFMIPICFLTILFMFDHEPGPVKTQYRRFLAIALLVSVVAALFSSDVEASFSIVGKFFFLAIFPLLISAYAKANHDKEQEALRRSSGRDEGMSD